MVFRKPSLRTRVSFEMGMIHLGGQALHLSPAEIKVSSQYSGVGADPCVCPRDEHAGSPLLFEKIRVTEAPCLRVPVLPVLAHGGLNPSPVRCRATPASIT